MYHAIHADDDISAVDAEDLPYAVSVSEFTRQLDQLATLDVGLCDEQSMPDVIITFDDGHGSNLHLAAPLLVERKLPAYFFVTTDFIDKRAHFMSSEELGQLSRMPGMCIGSHGTSHRFFDDLTPEESLRELNDSRTFLEQVCGCACRSMSFPGGRFTPGVLSQLKSAGYTQWFGSELGLISDARFLQTKASETSESERWFLATQREARPLERVAIRRSTQIDEFRSIICQESGYFRRKQMSSRVKRLLRQIIGNRLYHGLYKSIAER